VAGEVINGKLIAPDRRGGDLGSLSRLFPAISIRMVYDTFQLNDSLHGPFQLESTLDSDGVMNVTLHRMDSDDPNKVLKQQKMVDNVLFADHPLHLRGSSGIEDVDRLLGRFYNDSSHQCCLIQKAKQSRT